MLSASTSSRLSLQACPFVRLFAQVQTQDSCEWRQITINSRWRSLAKRSCLLCTVLLQALEIKSRAYHLEDRRHHPLPPARQRASARFLFTLLSHSLAPGLSWEGNCSKCFSVASREDRKSNAQNAAHSTQHTVGRVLSCLWP